MDIAITIIVAAFFGCLWGFFIGISSNELSDGTNKQFKSAFLTAIYRKCSFLINLLTAGLLGIIFMLTLPIAAFVIPGKLGYPDSYLTTYTMPSFLVSLFIGKAARKWVGVNYVQHM